MIIFVIFIFLFYRTQMNLDDSYYRKSLMLFVCKFVCFVLFRFSAELRDEYERQRTVDYDNDELMPIQQERMDDDAPWFEPPITTVNVTSPVRSIVNEQQMIEEKQQFDQKEESIQRDIDVYLCFVYYNSHNVFSTIHLHSNH